MIEKADPHLESGTQSPHSCRYRPDDVSDGRRAVVEIANAHVQSVAQEPHARSYRLNNAGKTPVRAAVRGDDEILQAWIPHSTLPVPVHRPARP